MVTFTFQNGIVATLRTSGTEPKIKYYTEFCAPPGERFVSSIRSFKMDGFVGTRLLYWIAGFVLISETSPLTLQKSS